MKIGGPISLEGIFSYFNYVHRSRNQLAAVPQSDQAETPADQAEMPADQEGATVNREAFIRIRSMLAELNKAAAELSRTSQRLGPLRSKSRARTAVATAANATSALELGDLGTGTAAVMTSTEEVNATPTSFSPFGPAWTGSTAQAAIGGNYDGSNGTMTLTFKVDREGTHGVDDVKIKVYDANSDEIDTIDIKKEHPIDQQYTLSNGLILTLGEGDLLKNDTFTVDVDDSVPMSFSPPLPQWTGSTALGSLDGVYDGSNGSMTLTFRVDREGTHGVDDLRIKVYDANEDEIDQIDINKEDPIDQEYTLSNGLIFTLGDGDLLKNTTFTLGVYDAVGSAVDPSEPLNGTRNNNPNLEYGLSVTDGSFELNGTTIDIYASDTINAVLDRITQSDAGVSATFDAVTETVVLTQKTLGSVPTITLANDTSGFLAAMKLESATPTPGIDGDPEKPLEDVARFSSVQSGSVSVNGVAIAIDVDVDSLNDVLDRINASAAGVTASYDSTVQRVTIVSNDPSQELVLDSSGTGFFPALEISDDTYQPTQGSAGSGQASWGRRGMTQSHAFEFAGAVQDVAEGLNALFEEPESGAVPDAFLMQLRQEIETAIQQSFDSEGSHFETKFGVEFDLRDTEEPIFDFSEDDRNRVASSLIYRRDDREIHNLFLGNRYLNRDGFVTRLTAALKRAESDLEMTLEGQGLLPNLWA